MAIELPDHMLKDVIDTLPAEKIVEALEELESDDLTLVDVTRNALNCVDSTVRNIKILDD